MRIFILGGARSGKSSYAERLAAGSGLPRLYLATAQAKDAEMIERVRAHQARRVGWQTLEEPLAIAAIIANPEYASHFIVLDCLTLWLSNLMHAGKHIDQETGHLLAALRATRAHVALVSNEVGQGIVPDNALARQFIDAAGILHQQVAECADRVVWMAAGIPTLIKN